MSSLRENYGKDEIVKLFTLITLNVSVQHNLKQTWRSAGIRMLTGL